MNHAYKAYIHKALTQYPGDKEEIAHFLDWLDNSDTSDEPNIYAYGDAGGQYAYGYIDKESIDSYEIEEFPENTPTSTILVAWADEINEMVTGSDILYEALDAAAKTIKRQAVTNE